MAGSQPAQKATELTERQKVFLNRALKGDRLPLLARGDEIRSRANALSLERRRLQQEIDDLERSKAILDRYAKEISLGLKGTAQGTQQDFLLRAEMDSVRRNLTKVQNKLNEYGELEIRPHGWAKVLGGGWLAGSSTGIASEFSAVAVLIALGIAVTPAALAAAAAIGMAAGASLAWKATGKLELGASQVRKEMAAFTKISDIMGIGERDVEKGVWCLRNGVPITPSNIERDNDELLKALKQDAKVGKDFYKIIDSRVVFLWDPHIGYAAYFHPGGKIAVVCANNKIHKGFITNYGDGTRDSVQYPNVRWHPRPIERDMSRTKFEDDMNSAAERLLEKKRELDQKIDLGQISGE